MRRRTIGDVRPASAPAGAGAASGVSGAGAAAGVGCRRRVGSRARTAGVGAGAGAGAGAGGASGGGGDRFRCGSRLRRGRGCGCRCGFCRRGAAAAAASPSTARRVADVDRLALGHEDLGEHAGAGRGHLGVDLVGRHLEQRLVGVDVSPTCLNHRVIVPSVTVSPSCGIVTSTAFSSGGGRIGAAVQGAAGERERGLRRTARSASGAGGSATRGRRRSPPSSREVALGEQLGRPRPGDVHAEQRAVALGDDLHQAVGLADDQRRGSLPAKRWTDVTTSWPCSRACSSVSPQNATSGWQ